MNAARTAFTLATLLALAPAAPAAAGTLREVHVEPQPISVLGGRLRLQVPDDAKVQTVGALSTGDWPVPATRIDITSGGEEMIIAVQELFARTPNDFESAIRSQIKLPEDDEDFRLEKLDLESRTIKALALWSKKLEASREASVVLTVFLAQRDRTVQMLTFLVNGTAAADPGGCKLLAGRIARSLDAGDKRLPWSGGVRKLRMPKTKRQLKLRVPKGFVLLREDTGGAQHYRLQRIRRLDETDPGTLELIVIADASYDPNRTRADVGLSERKLLGHPVKWYRTRQRDETGQSVLVEDGVIDPELTDAPELRLHVVISSADADHLAAFRGIADALDWTL